MGSTVVPGTPVVIRSHRCDGLTIPRVPFQPGDPAYAFPKLGEYIGLLKRLNVEDERSIDNVLSSFTEMYVLPLFPVQFLYILTIEPLGTCKSFQKMNWMSS